MVTPRLQITDYKENNNNSHCPSVSLNIAFPNRTQVVLHSHNLSIIITHCEHKSDTKSHVKIIQKPRCRRKRSKHFSNFPPLIIIRTVLQTYCFLIVTSFDTRQCRVRYSFFFPFIPRHLQTLSDHATAYAKYSDLEFG